MSCNCMFFAMRLLSPDQRAVEIHSERQPQNLRRERVRYHSVARCQPAVTYSVGERVTEQPTERSPICTSLLKSPAQMGLQMLARERSPASALMAGILKIDIEDPL